MIDLVEGVLTEFAERAAQGMRSEDLEGLLIRITDPVTHYHRTNEARLSKYQRAIAARRCVSCKGQLGRPYREKAKCLSCGALNYVPAMTRRRNKTTVEETCNAAAA